MRGRWLVLLVDKDANQFTLFEHGPEPSPTDWCVSGCGTHETVHYAIIVLQKMHTAANRIMH
jgi:hypothetical protein